MNKRTWIGFVSIIFILRSIPCYAEIADIEAAIMDRDYTQVKTLSLRVLKNPANSQQAMEAEYYFGLAQLRLGQYAQAREAFQNVMDNRLSKSMYDRAALGKTESLYLAGFYKDALVEGEKLLRKSPHSQYLSLIYLKMARINLKLMRWSKANEYLNKIVMDFPQSLEVPIAKQLLEEKEYFTVQVGSFEDKNRALALSNELKDAGHYAYIVETTSDNRIFYRVRVGQMTSLKDAKDMETKLAQLGYPTLIYP
jgi:tetratricopeptide (TPR) repeat protein